MRSSSQLAEYVSIPRYTRRTAAMTSNHSPRVPDDDFISTPTENISARPSSATRAQAVTKRV